MGCGFGGGRWPKLSSSNRITWGLLCLFTLGDGVCTLGSGVIFFLVADWIGVHITLGGSTSSLDCVSF
eukprot:6560490-Ditylum_brightwellii.AAC.1